MYFIKPWQISSANSVCFVTLPPLHPSEMTDRQGFQPNRERNFESPKQS
jgi:hypothetical protein